MPSLCVYTCNLLPPPLPQLLLIADYSQTLKYTRLSPSRAEFMYTCMRVEARYEAKYGGFIYPLETHRVICMCTYVRACTMCVCVCVCMCVYIATYHSHNCKEKKKDSSSHRKRAATKPERVERLFKKYNPSRDTIFCKIFT